MRKLKNIKLAHTRNISKEKKDKLLIAESFNGSVALETWEVDGKLVLKAVCFKSVTDYLLGKGDFKNGM